MTLDEQVEHYASSYSGILPKEVIESSKEWWRKELEQAYTLGQHELIHDIMEWQEENKEYDGFTGADVMVVTVDELIRFLFNKE